MQKRLYLKFGAVQMAVAIVYSYFQILLRNNGYSYTQIGYIQASYEVFGVIGPLVVGALADRTRRYKPFLLMAVVFSGLFYCMVAFISGSLIGSMAATAGLAFMFLNINSLNDLMGMNQLKGDTEQYGKVRSFGSITYVIMQILFAVTKYPDINSNKSIAFAMAVITVYFAFIVLINPEIHPEEPEKQTGIDSSRFADKWYDPVFFIGMTAVFFLHIPCAVIDRMLPLYFVDVIGAGDKFTLFLALQAGSEILSMLYVSKKLREGKVKPYYFFTIAAAGLLIRMMIYMLFPTTAGCIVSALFHSVTFGSFFPAAIAFVDKHIRSDRKATGMAIYTSLATGLPAALCTLCGGKIIDDYGYNTLFISASLFSVVSMLIMFGFRKKFRKYA